MAQSMWQQDKNEGESNLQRYLRETIREVSLNYVTLGTISPPPDQ